MPSSRTHAATEGEMMDFREHSAHERAAIAMLGELIVGCAGLVVLVTLGALTADWWTGLNVIEQVLDRVTK